MRDTIGPVSEQLMTLGIERGAMSELGGCDLN